MPRKTKPKTKESSSRNAPKMMNELDRQRYALSIRESILPLLTPDSADGVRLRVIIAAQKIFIARLEQEQMRSN